MSSHWQVLLLLICLCVIAPVYAQDTTVPADAAAAEIDRTFGVVEAYYRPEDAVTLGASWDRVIFAWYEFQPNGPDEFITAAIPQEYLDAAAIANRQIVGLIKGTAIWASPSGSPGAVPDGIDLPHDDPGNFYGAFVRQLVTHYSQLGIHHWIIMNEPDVRHGEGVVEFQGEVEDYAKMLRVAYMTIHEVDPDAMVLIGGLAWWPDRNGEREPYLRRLLQTIALDPDREENNWYFDGVCIHIYYTTSSVWPIIRANHTLLLQAGQGRKEIWLSEFNASPHLDPLAEFEAPFAINLEQQANYIVQASATALAADVDRLAVYRLYDNHFTLGVSEPWGLVRGNGSRRPAFRAYQQVIERFAGANTIERFTNDEATLITFRFTDHTVYVMWADTTFAGQFVINAVGMGDSVWVSNAMGERWLLPLTPQGSAPVANIEARPAHMIDMPWMVVSGPVRIVDMDGPPRAVWYRSEQGWMEQIN